MSPSRLLRVWCGVLGAKTRKLDLIGVLGTVKDPAVTKMPAATRADSDLAAASRPSPKPSPGKSFSRVFVRQTRHAHWLNRTEIQSSAADITNQPLTTSPQQEAKAAGPSQVCPVQTDHIQRHAQARSTAHWGVAVS